MAVRLVELLVYLYAALQFAAFFSALVALYFVTVEDILTAAKAALTAAASFFASRIVLLALARSEP